MSAGWRLRGLSAVGVEPVRRGRRSLATAIGRSQIEVRGGIDSDQGPLQKSAMAAVSIAPTAATWSDPESLVCRNRVLAAGSNGRGA
jgi:hypothetical protein